MTTGTPAKIFISYATKDGSDGAARLRRDLEVCAVSPSGRTSPHSKAGGLYIATCLSNLAFLYRAQGRLAEAEPLYKRALEMQEKGLPAGHPDIANSLAID
jgi:hypothetical protein